MNDVKNRLTIGLTVVRLPKGGELLRLHLYAHEPDPLSESLIEWIAGHSDVMRAGRLSRHRMLVEVCPSLSYDQAHALLGDLCVSWFVQQSFRRELRIQSTYPALQTWSYDLDS
jgi:hypothetical protein